MTDLMFNLGSINLTEEQQRALAVALTSTNAVYVQAVAARGAAAAGNNSNADILVLVTDRNTGAGITSLTQADFTVVDHFGIPGQSCGFSNNITSFNNVGTGAYQITVATHSTKPPAGGCTWVAGNYLGQVIVKTAAIQGQAAFLLSI
jgi:hypothetical protein